MRIGIMGGSFDPVHNGHVEMASFCLKKFSLDKIMFLPLGDPPHKNGLTDKEIRLQMLEKAIENEENFYISKIEAEREGKTYTFETMTWLKENTPDEYFYIIGADTVNTLHKWYRAEELFKILDFIVVDRENIDMKDGIKKVTEMGARLMFAHHTGLDVSSTDIRQAVKNGEDISPKVNAGVLEIIKENDLYRD